jgi:hypothetical protein
MGRYGRLVCGRRPDSLPYADPRPVPNRSMQGIRGV